MGGATPDAYRIGTGQVARDYPADAAPVRLRKQPSLPTVARAPESSLVEQVVSAEDAVVRGKAPGSPRPSRLSRPSEDAAAVAQQAAVARDVVSSQAGRVAQPSTPVREYAHRDEAAATYGTDPRPGVPVHRNWHRTTMRVVGAPEQRDGGQCRALAEAVSPSEQGVFKSLVSEVPLGARPRLVVPARLSRAWIVASVRRIAGVPSSSSRSASCPPSSS